VFEQSCTDNHIEFHHKQNHVRCVAHIINLAVQEVLKYLKSEEAHEENLILENISKNNNTDAIIPKVRIKYYLIKYINYKNFKTNYLLILLYS